MFKHFQNKWIRKQGCKLAGGLQSIHKHSTLILEEKAELGHVSIKSPHLEIGAYSYIRSGCKLELVSHIGRFCSISSNVHIGQAKRVHPINWVSSHPFQYTNSPLKYDTCLNYVTIGHDVWIGNDVLILEGITIGTGAIVATHAVVTKDIPPYAIVGGNPATIIRYRHDASIIKELLNSQWWNYSVEDLKKLHLDSPLTFINELNTQHFSQKTYQKIKLTQKSYSLLS